MAHDEFTIHLVSSASMNIFPDNTLAKFKNFLSQEINLEDDWRVAISEIIFPANLYNVTDSLVKIYRKQNIGKRIAETIQDGLSGNTISRKYRGESVKIKKGSYETVESLIEELKNPSSFENIKDTVFAAIYVFDDDNENHNAWLETFTHWTGALTIVKTKIDDENQPNPGVPEKITQWLNQNRTGGFSQFAVSAKTGVHVREAFEDTIARCGRLLSELVVNIPPQ